jgi:hypothetical protein
MKRDAVIAETLPDPVRLAAGLPIGNDGAYFVGGIGNSGQDHDISVISGNYPPPEQPGLWCQWIPNDDDTAIVWDEGEKFYEFLPWLNYIITHFLNPWGYTLKGKVIWQGEDIDDRGAIFVIDNNVTTVDFEDDLPEETKQVSFTGKTYLYTVLMNIDRYGWDTLEVHPVKNISTDSESTQFEQCEPNEADMWSVYIHMPDQGLECIADCDSESTANDLVTLINTLIKTHVYSK